jgi:hypothetical protein
MDAGAMLAGAGQKGWVRRLGFETEAEPIVPSVPAEQFALSDAETDHQFCDKASDWGFTSFMPLADLLDPTSGFVVNDTVLVRADVQVKKVVDYWNWDSKKETGFVGLKNQGATCYMNSLLQTLYHIPYFRKVGPRFVESTHRGPFSGATDAPACH